MNQILINAGIGLCGALVKMIIEDGGLNLPTLKNGKLYLGSIGGMIIGMIAGCVADHDIITTFLGGYAGSSAIAFLVSTQGLQSLGGFLNSTADGQNTTATTAAATATTAVAQQQAKNSQPLTITQQIQNAAVAAGIDPVLAVAVATCESGLNPNATNINTDGSADRGLYQINNRYHPEVSDQQAFDPAFSIQFFITAYKAGNISWWSASQKCWGPSQT